jgi:hypothetical protein
MKEGLSIEGDSILIWEDSLVVITIKKPPEIGLMQVESYVEWILEGTGQGLSPKGKETK